MLTFRELMFLAAMLVSLSFGGCVHGSRDMRDESILIAPDIYLDLPPLNDFDQSIEAAQLVVATYQTETATLQARISITPGRMKMLFYDPVGRVALTIDWGHGSPIYTQAPFFPGAIPPQNILADFVLMHWPITSLKGRIHGAGIHIQDSGTLRTVRSNGVEIINIEYHGKNRYNGTSTYSNIPWGYHLSIQSVQQ